jgi:hypothetical protein
MTKRFLVAVLALASTGALALDGQRTTLGCSVGGEGADRQVQVRNGTGDKLKPETVINYNVYWKKQSLQGQSAGCFAIRRELGPNLQVAEKLQLAPGAEPTRCEAYVSEKYPRIVHEAGGGVEMRCDP